MKASKPRKQAARPTRRTGSGSGSGASRGALRAGSIRSHDVRLLARRATAVLLDTWLLQLPALILATVVLAAVLQITTPDQVDLDELTRWAVGSWLATAAVLEGFVLHRYGRTPGRRISRIRVQRPDGNNPSWSEALLYCLVRLPLFTVVLATFIPAVVLLIGVNLLVWWKRERTGGEMLAGLRVVTTGGQ